MLDTNSKASELIYKSRFSNEIFVMISGRKAKDRMYSNQQKAVSLLSQISKRFLAKHWARALRSGKFLIFNWFSFWFWEKNRQAWLSTIISWKKRKTIVKIQDFNFWGFFDNVKCQLGLSVKIRLVWICQVLNYLELHGSSWRLFLEQD